MNIMIQDFLLLWINVFCIISFGIFWGAINSRWLLFRFKSYL